MLAPSLSKEPFGDDDYDDGEVYDLRENNALRAALATERWLNWSLSQQQHWQRKMTRPMRFLGYVLSTSRQQAEITLIYEPQAGLTSYMESVTVTLANFSRFI